MSVEASRKHGPFDTRWPSDRKDRHGREWRNNGPPKTPRLRLVPPEPVETAIEAESETGGAQRRLAAVAALQVWDWEGGYTPGSNES